MIDVFILYCVCLFLIAGDSLKAVEVQLFVIIPNNNIYIHIYIY